MTPRALAQRPDPARPRLKLAFMHRPESTDSEEKLARRRRERKYILSRTPLEQVEAGVPIVYKVNGEVVEGNRTGAVLSSSWWTAVVLRFAFANCRRAALDSGHLSWATDGDGQATRDGIANIVRKSRGAALAPGDPSVPSK